MGRPCICCEPIEPIHEEADDCAQCAEETPLTAIVEIDGAVATDGTPASSNCPNSDCGPLDGSYEITQITVASPTDNPCIWQGHFAIDLPEARRSIDDGRRIAPLHPPTVQNTMIR